MKLKPLIKKFSYEELVKTCTNKGWQIPSLKDVEGKDLEYEEFWVSDLPEKKDRETHAHIYNQRCQVLQLANKHFLINAVVIVDENACEWKYVEDSFFGGHWHTSCKNDFSITNDGSPSENKFAYCCYCGETLKEAR